MMRSRGRFRYLRYTTPTGPSRGGSFRSRTPMSAGSSGPPTITHDPDKDEQSGLCENIAPDSLIMLSSCKTGFGADNLVDGNLDTFWQSDSTQPHTVTILFSQLTKVVAVYLYIDHKLDESYTPLQINLKYGIRKDYLTLADTVNLVEPSGWIRIPRTDIAKNPRSHGGSFGGNLSSSSQNATDSDEVCSPSDFGPNQLFLPAWMLEINIISNHQSGRDSHIRQIKVHTFGSRKPVPIEPTLTTMMNDSK